VFVNNKHRIRRRGQHVEKVVFDALLKKRSTDEFVTNNFVGVCVTCPLNSRLVINSLNVFFNAYTAMCATTCELCLCL